MRKVKRFNYSVSEVIVGMPLEEAREICLFNGFGVLFIN